MRSQDGSQARHSPQKCTTHFSHPPSSTRAAVGDRRLPVALPSTPVPSGYAGLQGRICIHQGPPAPNKGLQWLHRRSSLSPPLPQPSIIPPLPHRGCQHSHLCRGQAQSTTPVLFDGCHSCGGHRDMSDTAQSLPTAHYPLAAHTDLLALPHCHVLLQILLQQARVPCSLQQHSSSHSSATTAGHRGPCATSATAARTWGPLLFTLLVKLARGVQAPRSTAHSEAFPPCSSSRRSSGRPGSAPGNVPTDWVGSEGRPRTGSPQLDPQVAPTLPPQQYSRSRRHWVSRTCPPLHTCPRERINSAWR